MKIAVIGATGMVGKTITEYYEGQNNVVGYSLENINDDFGKLVQGSEVIFICVPTPFDWDNDSYDLSLIEESLGKIDQAHGDDKLLPDTLVVLKSTVPPTTTETLQNRFVGLNLFFNPEFLSESTHDSDFAYPDRQIIGVTKKEGFYTEMKLAKKLLSILPYAPYRAIVKSEEAEIIKYVNNFWGALNVCVGNFIDDICEMTNSRTLEVKNASRASGTIGRRNVDRWWNVEHKGFRGYGGKCFPKDMHTLNKWLQEKGYAKPSLIQGVIKFNEDLLAEQNLTEMSVEGILPVDNKQD